MAASSNTSTSTAGPKPIDPNANSPGFLSIVYRFDSPQSKLKTEHREMFRPLAYLRPESRFQVFKDQYIYMDMATSKKKWAGFKFIQSGIYLGAHVNIFKVLKTQYLNQLAIVFDDYPD